MVGLSALPDVWTHFRRLKPQVALSLREGLPSLVVPALLEGSLDFAVVMAESGLVPDALSFEPLVRSSFFVVGRKGHPMAHAKNIEALLGYEWIFSIDRKSTRLNSSN